MRAARLYTACLAMGLFMALPRPAESQSDGSVVPLSAVSSLPTLQYPVTVTIGEQPAQIEYQGPAPLAVAGLYQINCVIPPGTPSGPAAVVVTADGRQSQPNLTLAVR